MISADEIRGMIEQGLAGAKASVRGDDGAHFEAEVVSPDFEGKSIVAQHRLVYAALGGRMGGDIHALALRTYTPGQWDRREPA